MTEKPKLDFSNLPNLDVWKCGAEQITAVMQDRMNECSGAMWSLLAELGHFIMLIRPYNLTEIQWSSMYVVLISFIDLAEDWCLWRDDVCFAETMNVRS